MAYATPFVFQKYESVLTIYHLAVVVNNLGHVKHIIVVVLSVIVTEEYKNAHANDIYLHEQLQTPFHLHIAPCKHSLSTFKIFSKIIPNICLQLSNKNSYSKTLPWIGMLDYVSTTNAFLQHNTSITPYVGLSL